MQPPPAVGVRLDWLEVPVAVRAKFADWARSRVAKAISQPSGFSPGVAARLRFEDGRRLFVKAVGPKPNADSPQFHRREARAVAALPENVPVPRLRWWLDDPDSGWVVLVFDEVDGGRLPRRYRPMPATSYFSHSSRHRQAFRRCERSRRRKAASPVSGSPGALAGADPQEKRYPGLHE